MSTAIESLLGLKTWKEEEAKNLFALALRDVAIEEDRLRNLEDALISVEREFLRFKEGDFDVEEIRRALEYQDSLVKQIALQRTKIQQKEKIAEKARVELVEATKEKKIFERLHEKQQEAEAKRILSIEQRLSDESATTRVRYFDED